MAVRSSENATREDAGWKSTRFASENWQRNVYSVWQVRIGVSASTPRRERRIAPDVELVILVATVVRRGKARRRDGGCGWTM